MLDLLKAIMVTILIVAGMMAVFYLSFIAVPLLVTGAVFFIVYAAIKEG